TITISGVRVVDPFNDLAAGHIGLSFTGNVITNIDSEIINRADPASTTNFDILRPNQTGFKAWAQGPRAVSNALNVGGVGADGRPTTAGNTITVSWTAGPAFTINGNTTQFGAGQQSINLSAPATIHGVTVPHSTLFVPFRSVVAAMTNTHTETPLQGESVITFFEGSGDNPHSIVLEFGDNTAQFIIGQSTFVLNGLTLPMTNPATGAAVYTFIGDGTNGTVANVTYLPLRFIAAALGFDIADGVGQSIVTPR
ncbi:MAG: copper amine oxidase N-terminal domain-containing protein, partial [Defluviitaleaceae bacterium]|nr:copper amine oxidase N-terminal domain-containing protein [Defluviitaleaceae bacterium]